jgi:glutamine amidotransferase
LQVLFERSEESRTEPGFGFLAGEVLRFRAGKVPQIGWNRVEPATGSGWEAGYAYFVNSYAARPSDPSVTLYEADYHGPFCAAVRRDNLTAFQFHPEKSGAFGHALLRRWVDAV